MTRADRRENWQTMVGALAMLLLAGFIYYAFAGKVTDDQSGYVVGARFKQVDGLNVGSPVLLAGVKVGEVTALSLERETLQPLVRFRISNTVRLPVDSAAYVMSDGVLGAKFVKIEPGLETRTMREGDRFEMVQNSVIVENLLERIVRAAEARRAPRKQQ
jgi:phospholipid/cholesterol/gamma-HCH transport system substrate-binding protein